MSEPESDPPTPAAAESTSTPNPAFGRPSKIFGGVVPGLAEDLKALHRLPQPAKQALWELIAPNLGDTVGDSAQQAAERFAAVHKVPLEDIIPLVRGCRRLFRRAAAVDLPVEAVHQDVQSLCQDRELARRLAACYEQALPLIRTAAVLTSLSRFGAELVDIGLRMDHVSTSRHTPAKMVPVAMLSLRYREASEVHNITLQAAPPVLRRLKQMLDTIFG